MRYREAWKIDFNYLWMCIVVQSCNSAANMVVMGLVLGQSTMAISAIGYYAKYLPFIMFYGSVFVVVYM